MSGEVSDLNFRDEGEEPRGGKETKHKQTKKISQNWKFRNQSELWTNYESLKIQQIEIGIEGTMPMDARVNHRKSRSMEIPTKNRGTSRHQKPDLEIEP